MYRQLGTVVHAAMSADSSCRGLRSPRDGPIVLELTKGLSLSLLSTLALLNGVTRTAAAFSFDMPTEKHNYKPKQS